MAKNKRNRRYRFTPRRQAALRKAQAVSARSRRRRVSQAVGLVGATLAVGAVAYAGTKTINNRKISARANLRTSAKARISARPPKVSKALVHVPGLGKSYVEIKRKPKPNPKPRQSGPKTVWKVNANGGVTRTTKTRMIYDLNRRREYWQGKPVGGAPRKKYTSKKRGRR